MARLFVVVGYPDAKPASEPFPVYVGSSGEAMRAAKAKSTAARFLEYHNVPGIRKNNPNAAANAAAEAAQPIIEAAAAPETPPADPAPVPAESKSRRRSG